MADKGARPEEYRVVEYVEPGSRSGRPKDSVFGKGEYGATLASFRFDPDVIAKATREIFLRNGGFMLSSVGAAICGVLYDAGLLDENAVEDKNLLSRPFFHALRQVLDRALFASKDAGEDLSKISIDDFVKKYLFYPGASHIEYLKLALSGVWFSHQSALDSAQVVVSSARARAKSHLLTVAGERAADAEERAVDAERRARTDALTGMPNRGATFDEIDRIFKQGSGSGKKVLVLTFDGDHFKQTNDTYGHAAGDAVLRKIAEISGGLDFGIIGRIGGEEFLGARVLEEGENAAEIAESLRAAMQAGLGSVTDVNGQTHHINQTVSVGYYISDGSLGVDAAVKCADTALYDAKKQRNCVCGFAATTFEDGADGESGPVRSDERR